MISPRIGSLLVAIVLAPVARGAEIKVMLSGAFGAAYRELVPQFERETGNKIVTEYGLASVGNRIQSGELADVVILAGSGLEELIKQGRVLPDSRVDLVRSSIGVAVRAGASKPDISTVDALNVLFLTRNLSRIPAA
jgi:molybdate transport system substrate-binding protein